MIWRDTAIEKAIPLADYVTPIVDIVFIANGRRERAMLHGVTPDLAGIKP